MCGDDVGMFREVLTVLELSLEVGPFGAYLADGLDGHPLAVSSVIGYPGGAVGALSRLLDKSEPLVQTRLVIRRFDDRHCTLE